MTAIPSSSSSTSTSTCHTKHFKPYFTPSEVERLSEKQRGKLSVSREERGRQQACGFIDAVGVRCGFPRRTIATAQSLYMRFHLFFAYNDFKYTEVSLSCLYVSSKLHDTLKKPREIVLSSYAIRYPNLIRRGVVDQAAAEANGLEIERRQVLNIERLVLETMCFKFGVDTALKGVIKFGRRLKMSKTFCQNAWRVTVDCYRTLAPLSYPPHIIALGSIYTASLLLLEAEATKLTTVADLPENQDGECGPKQIANSASGLWEKDFSASATHIDDVAHHLIDMYTILLSDNPTGIIHTPSPVSPKEATSSSTPKSSSNSLGTTAFALSTYPYWTAVTLTELKIHLRNTRPSSITPYASGWMTQSTSTSSVKNTDNPVTTTAAAAKAVDQAVQGLGKNDGTIRFLWETA